MAADYAERARAAADFYAARGMRVHPCRGKVPLTRWSAAATTDPAQLAAWWAPGSTANVAIATGGGLVVLDVDVDRSAGKYGDETLAHLEQEHGALPATWTCLTGGGGVHYYFRCEDPRLSVGTQIAPGLDYRGPGGYVIAPPSVHPTTGRTYEWEVNGHPFAVPLAPLPEWLHELMLKGREREKKTGQAQEAAEPIMAGGRNDAIFREAARLRAAGLTLQELLAAVGEINRQRCQPPLEDAEIETICKSAARYARGDLYGAPAFSPLADPPAPQELASSPEEYGPAAVDAFLEAVQGERYKPIPTGLSAIDAALGLVNSGDNSPVPLHLRNAPTKLMKDLGYHEGYRYAHDYEGNFTDQEFLPENLSGTKFYEPGNNARENEIRARMDRLWPKYNH